ncbi:MAG TPA: sigma-70 family RNA polymerase sigma factor [Verrucomicrobiae bacterium]
METLCRAYWYPLYAYTRRRGYGVEEAQDLTQEFFARLLSRHWLGQADNRRGKFRSFLLASLTHFLANEWRKTQTAKRGGGKTFLWLEEDVEKRYAVEGKHNSTPENDYERQWAMTLFDRGLVRLQRHYETSGKGLLFTELVRYLWREESGESYSTTATRLGMSAGALRSAVFRFRRDYRALIRDEIAQTVSDSGEVDDELRSLLGALSAS